MVAEIGSKRANPVVNARLRGRCWHVPFYLTGCDQNDDERKAQNQAWTKVDSQSIHLSANLFPLEPRSP